MANKVYDEEYIRDIANAIRAKSGTSNKYTVAQMSAAIRALEGSISEDTTLIDSGLYGDNVNWYLYDNGVLILNGNGDMPDGDIEGSPFEGNELVEYVIIQDGITDIAAFAFLDCINMKNIFIPNSVTSIKMGAFGDCVSLTDLIIPNRVTNIPSMCSGCTNLTKVFIPHGVVNIGEFAFEGCNNLTSVTIPDTVTNISDYAFNYCTSLTDVFYAGTKSQWDNIAVGSSNEAITNATLHCEYNSNTGADNGWIIDVIDDGSEPENITKPTITFVYTAGG